MKLILSLIFLFSFHAFAQNSNEYRSDYDLSVEKVSRLISPELKSIILQENVGRSLMFLPITKVEINENSEIEIFTEYCSRKITVSHEQMAAGTAVLSLNSISEGSCSGD